jgi:organic radical activating enzyme
MHANNLSISVPYKGCDKKCPYCVSEMTGFFEESDSALWRSKFHKVKKLADVAGVNSVSVTGKGEPLLNMEAVKEVGSVLAEFPLELQTNGKKLTLETLAQLSRANYDVIAVSVDNIKQLDTDIFKEITKLGMIPRITVNITDMLPVMNFAAWLSKVKESGVEQLSFRQITTANYTEHGKVHDWIEKHAPARLYNNLIANFKENYLDTGKARLLRALPYGAKLYDVEGISFTYFDYCIQDTSNGDDIRSLIYQEDGHMYTAWNSKASRIF